MKTSEVNYVSIIGKKSFVGNDVRERCEWVTVAVMWLYYQGQVRFDTMVYFVRYRVVGLKSIFFSGGR